MDKAQTCCVCNGAVTEDGGVELKNGDWVCCSGCWCDFHVGKAAFEHKNKKLVGNFLESMEKLKLNDLK